MPTTGRRPCHFCLQLHDAGFQELSFSAVIAFLMATIIAASSHIIGLTHFIKFLASSAECFTMLY